MLDAPNQRLLVDLGGGLPNTSGVVSASAVRLSGCRFVRFCVRQASNSGQQAVNLRVTPPDAVPPGSGRSAHLVTGSGERGHRCLEVLAAVRGGDLCPDPCLADWYHWIAKADHVNALI